MKGSPNHSSPSYLVTIKAKAAFLKLQSVWSGMVVVSAVDAETSMVLAFRGLTTGLWPQVTHKGFSKL